MSLSSHVISFLHCPCPCPIRPCHILRLLWARVLDPLHSCPFSLQHIRSNLQLPLLTYMTLLTCLLVHIFPLLSSGNFPSCFPVPTILPRRRYFFYCIRIYGYCVSCKVLFLGHLHFVIGVARQSTGIHTRC